MTSPPLLELDALSVAYAGPHGRVTSLDAVGLVLPPGEALGIVGESGSGKSQLLLAIMGLLPVQAMMGGRIALDGTDLAGLPPARRRALRAASLAMVFQDPASALNPYLTIGRQLTEVPMHRRGLGHASAHAAASRALDRVRMTEPARRLKQYPHELSGGMRQRVMIAMALLAEPKLLLADEPTTALDVTIQAEILEILRELTRDGAMALMLVTHDLGVVAHLSQRIALMYAGRIVEAGPLDTVFKTPAHPYSRALLAAMPRLDDDPRARLQAIAGQPPNPAESAAHRSAGCAFAPRCPSRMARCAVERPRLMPVTPVQHAACFLLEGSTTP